MDRYDKNNDKHLSLCEFEGVADKIIKFFIDT